MLTQAVRRSSASAYRGSDAQLAYYVMLWWTRVAASETHELCLDHHVHDSPNSPHRRHAIPINHPPSSTLSSLFHCDRRYRLGSTTVPPHPLIAGKPAGATAQLHTLPPISATAPSSLNAADGCSATTTPTRPLHPPNTQHNGRPYICRRCRWLPLGAGPGPALLRPPAAKRGD